MEKVQYSSIERPKEQDGRMRRATQSYAEPRRPTGCFSLDSESHNAIRTGHIVGHRYLSTPKQVVGRYRYNKRIIDGSRWLQLPSPSASHPGTIMSNLTGHANVDEHVLFEPFTGYNWAGSEIACVRVVGKCGVL